MPKASAYSAFRLAWLCLLLIQAGNFLSQNLMRPVSKEAWSFRQAGTQTWHPATVPGTIHSDLLSQTLIPDPFFADNETSLQWIDTLAWEYQSFFRLSEQELAHDHLTLIFNGLDTYANVYLNDSLIIRADNMFRSWKKEVKPYLKKGINRLLVAFDPALKKGQQAAAGLPYTLPGEERVFTRKAQCHYGWDWGPRFVTCGIWKDVNLLMWREARLEHVIVNQEFLSDSLAKLKVDVEVEVAAPGNYTLQASALSPLPGHSEVVVEPVNANLEKGKQRLVLSITVKHPERWWSNGLGHATLYSFDVALKQGQRLIDHQQWRTGLRSIELVQEKDTAGRSFYFRLNGVPVFMKGANYIPPDHFLPRVPASTYKSLVQQAKEAHMNMIRVWGGGVYADVAFYEACDEHGILVWQDLMFACAMYPGDSAFVQNVEAEVEEVAASLANHPCIALWCGNNENDEGWKNWGWQKQYHYSAADSAQIWKNYLKLFHHAIPAALARVRESTIYWPSSPSVGWGRKESLLQGDVHYWGVWWGMEPFEVYERKVGRFMSEYGFQGMPQLATLQAVAAPGDLSFGSKAMRNHQKHAKGYETISEYMARDYPLPISFKDYAYVSQLLQARGMQLAIEAHRRARPYCMGSLYWQLNDSWPVTSWSSTDYYLRKKALYYTVAKAFDDLLISFETRDDSLQLYVISDLLKDTPCTLRLRVLRMDGKVMYSDELPVSLEANSSRIFRRDALKELCKAAKPEELILSAILTHGDSIFASATYAFVKPKALVLRKPVFKTSFHPTEGYLEISCPVFAKGVWLHEDGFEPSDNYFDLLPGEIKRIRLRSSRPLRKDQVFVISSLYDIK